MSPNVRLPLAGDDAGSSASTSGAPFHRRLFGHTEIDMDRGPKQCLWRATATPAILPQLCWPFNRRFPLDFLSIPMYHMPQGSIAALYVPFSCRRLPSSGQSLASARSEERNKAPLEKGADTNDSEPIPFECDETFACQLSTEVLRTSGGLPTAPRAPAALLLLHSPYCRFSSVRKHRVQICIRRISPSIMTRFLCTLDLNWRFVFFLERGTVLPNWAPLPQILHFAIDLTSNSLIFVHNEVMLL